MVTIDGTVLTFAAAAATLIGSIGAITKALAAAVDWLRRNAEERRKAKADARADALEWSTTLTDSLQARLGEQITLAEQAARVTQDQRGQIIDLTVWARGAARVILMHDLTHLIDPPPGWSGEEPWPTTQPAPPQPPQPTALPPPRA